MPAPTATGDVMHSRKVLPFTPPRVDRIRLEIDLVGEAAARFQLAFNHINNAQPCVWTPSALGASIINEVLLDDAIAHQVSTMQH